MTSGSWLHSFTPICSNYTTQHNWPSITYSSNWIEAHLSNTTLLSFVLTRAKMSHFSWLTFLAHTTVFVMQQEANFLDGIIRNTQENTTYGRVVLWKSSEDISYKLVTTLQSMINAKLSKVLTLSWKWAHQDDSNDTPHPTTYRWVSSHLPFTED